MQRLWSQLALFGLLSAAFAGCLAPDVPDPGAGEGDEIIPTRDEIFARIQALMEGVPCEAPFSATKTTDNLKLLANTTIVHGDRAVGSRELDIRGNLALTTLAGAGAIGILDITDPLNPVQLSTIGSVGELDAKFASDNATAIVGSGAGIAIVDIRDPNNPVKTGQWTWDQAPQPPRGGPNQNAHMLYAARIADRDWVFLAPNSNTGVWILELTGEPGEKKLNYVTRTLPVQGGPLGPHDMTVQWDTQLKTWVLYSADGFHGWTAFDVKNPAQPELIGGVIKPETGYTHTIQAAKIGDRRIVVTIQEVGVNVLQVFDATNLRAPILLGTWQHSPAAVNPQHNLNIVAGRLYVAHYGNGVYVFDLNKIGTTPLVSEVKPVAHYGGAATGQNPLGFTQFYDVVVKDGVVYAASYSAPTAGIHIVGDGCLAPGDEDLTSIG
jgi:hypothetical protein